MQAADIWYSIKKHWCMEAQRLRRRVARIRDDAVIGRYA